MKAILSVLAAGLLIPPIVQSMRVVNSGGQYDIVVYGATPAGFSAALSAVDADPTLKVALVEPTNYVGGMAGPGGIGLRDFAVQALVNATALDWANRNAKHYGSSSPVWQPDFEIGNTSFWEMMGERGNLDVAMNEPLDDGAPNGGVKLDGTRVTAIQTTGGTWSVTSTGAFVDASYEGDVVARGGADVTWGRESKAQYNESVGGVSGTTINQFKDPVPATWDNGTLLKYVQDLPDPRTRIGDADGNLMAYAYRLCLTTNTSNQVTFYPPPGYRTEDFELPKRYLQLLKDQGKSAGLPWGNLPYRGYPRGDKFDACCGSNPFGIDAVGLGVGYPNGTWPQRRRVADEIRYYTLGLAWFYTGDPQADVPSDLRKELQKYGLCKDSWPENGHVPPQLYAREAYRLVGDRVFTQNDRVPSTGPNGVCRDDSVGVMTWGLDIHQMQRTPVQSLDDGGDGGTDGSPVVAQGGALRGAGAGSASAAAPVAFNEGLTSPGLDGHVPADMPAWLLFPKRSQLTNVMAPNCPSVSHVAFSALREEPTLMQLGMASGVLGALLAKGPAGQAVQDVSIPAMSAELRRQGSPLHFPLRENCSSPLPPVPSSNCSAFLVAGAGTQACNGLYKRDSPKALSWTLDSEHSIYVYGGEWHIAYNGHEIFYAAPAVSGGGPPRDGWKVSDGAAPAPTLKCENSEAGRA